MAAWAGMADFECGHVSGADAPRHSPPAFGTLFGSASKQ